MLGGLAGRPTNMYWIYVFLNWSIFFYGIAYGLFAVNGLAVRLDNQEADRWSSWTYWSFAISIGVAWMPAWFMHQLMYHNLITWYYTVYYIAALVVGLWLGVFTAKLIIDVTNCVNVSYCVDVDYPPTHDGPDASWYFAFFCTLYFILFIVIWFLIAIYIRNRLFYRATLDYYGNPNRTPQGGCGAYSSVSYSGNRIGDRVDAADTSYVAAHYASDAEGVLAVGSMHMDPHTATDAAHSMVYMDPSAQSSVGSYIPVSPFPHGSAAHTLHKMKSGSPTSKKE